MGCSNRVLVVDDEETSRALLTRMVESFGYEWEAAQDGLEALAKVSLDIDLVLLDVAMPDIDGFEVARRIRQDPTAGDVPIIMVTGLTTKQDRLRAVECGANDFVGKPVDVTELRVRTAAQLKAKEAQDVIRQHETLLEEKVEKRTSALRMALEKMLTAQRKAQEAHLDTIDRLAVAAEYKDEDTAAHIRRMRRFAGLLAHGLRRSRHEVESIRQSSVMHDVGKIGIPDAILMKPAKLTEQEWETMKDHTTIGARILADSSSDLLRMGETIALTHHEKWDGTGYPEGLAGEDIPLEGRICAVAEVFDALTSRRPYKEAFCNEKAFGILREDSGVHFDPQMVGVFLDNVDDVLAIQEQYRNGPETIVSDGG